jgi:hypothetical protein
MAVVAGYSDGGIALMKEKKSSTYSKFSAIVREYS